MNKLYFLLIIGILFSACNSTSETKNEESLDTETDQSQLTITEILSANPKIKIDSIQKKRVSQKVNCTGNVSIPPTDILSVHSRISGFIESMKYLPGDYVKKHAWLFRVGNPEIIEKQRIFLETKAELTLANKNYERKQILKTENATTTKSWDEALANRELLSATYDGLKSELEMLGVNVIDLETENKFQSGINVYAGQSGFVREVFVNKGQMVQPETKLMEISNNTYTHLELQVLSKDASLISKGQKVEFTLPNNPEVLSAKILKINPVLDNNSGTLNVHCQIDKKDKKQTIPGMFVNANISVEEREYYGLPMNAVIKEGNDYYAYVEEGKYLKKKLIDNPIVGDDFIAFNGFRTDRLVISGAYYVE